MNDWKLPSHLEPYRKYINPVMSLENIVNQYLDDMLEKITFRTTKELRISQCEDIIRKVKMLEKLHKDREIK